MVVESLIGSVCCSFTVLIATTQILMHLWNYNEPRLQLYISRIVLMVPAYSIQSFLSIIYPDRSLFFNTIRDCYEAYVLYLFTKLIIEYIGGEERVVTHFLHKKQIPHLWPFQNKILILNEKSYHRIKQGVFQFIVIKPLTSCLALLLAGWNVYKEADFSFDNGYLYCSIVNNISVTVSLYSLMLLYLACFEQLEPFGCVGKFLCIKAVIFFSFWQSCAFAIIVRLGWFGEFEEATLFVSSLQDLILCIEMALASVAYWKCFSWRDFVMKNKREYSFLKSVRDVLNVKDVIYDAKKTFTHTGVQLGYKENSWENI
ncbi:unnamed protein product [Blepharisma stoltei]|uniref:Uncharacterized protein n=1 Tax=Blepharisma stoltei TaxID=1481888 RepID=A0AAU9IQP9_9CILI|nr:unnamed protein product [Blepharisma stoltei]